MKLLLIHRMTLLYRLPLLRRCRNFASNGSSICCTILRQNLRHWILLDWLAHNPRSKSNSKLNQIQNENYSNCCYSHHLQSLPPADQQHWVHSLAVFSYKFYSVGLAPKMIHRKRASGSHHWLFASELTAEYLVVGRREDICLLDIRKKGFN